MRVCSRWVGGRAGRPAGEEAVARMLPSSRRPGHPPLHPANLLPVQDRQEGARLDDLHAPVRAERLQLPVAGDEIGGPGADSRREHRVVLRVRGDVGNGDRDGCEQRLGVQEADETGYLIGGYSLLEVGLAHGRRQLGQQRLG